MIFVPGIPLTAGSGDRSMSRIAGRVCWVGPYIDTSDRKTKKRKSGGLKRWKTAIAEHARMERCEPIDGPVTMRIDFFFPRPAKPKYAQPTYKQDLDKLVRAVLDALPGIAYHDDGQVCDLRATKHYVGSEFFDNIWTTGPGVSIDWCPLDHDGAGQS